MKITHALMSGDADPFYFDLLPIVAKSWNRIGIKPTMIMIGMEKQECEGVEFHYLPNIPGIKMNFLCLIGRIWGWHLINGVGLITDLDMMALSKEYFDSISLPYDESKMVSSASDAKEKFGQVASCYVLAHSDLMKKLINYNSWEEFAQVLGNLTDQAWGGDQWYFEQLLKANEGSINLKRGFNHAGQANRRIDRDDWRYEQARVKEGYYYDSHLLRPYSKYKEQVDKLYSLL